jgi:anti-sigma factor RsiW
MGSLSCRSVLTQLSPFHDGELPLDEEIAVAAHLRSCAACAAEARAIEGLGEALRATCRRGQLSWKEAVTLQATVVSRFRAERDETIASRIGRVLDDTQRLWAGLGAATVTALCILAFLTTLQLVSVDRKDSLAGILSAMASPGSNQNPVRLSVDERIRLPRLHPEGVMPAILVQPVAHDQEDLVVALATIITREGRLSGLEVLMPQDHNRRVVLEALPTVSLTRFEPASLAGSPVAVNMVWLLAHTTVRGS